MSKSNHVVNEAQLKARRTSLEKKTSDELISIILRKDSTERKNNTKIQELTNLLKEADSLNEEKATRILGFEKDMAGMEEIVKVKQEQIDNLISKYHSLETEHNTIKEKYKHTKDVAILRRKTIYGLIVIIIDLIVGLCVCI